MKLDYFYLVEYSYYAGKPMECKSDSKASCNSRVDILYKQGGINEILNEYEGRNSKYSLILIYTNFN